MKNEKKILEEILKELDSFDSIICLRHINPDGDAFGSQLGLKKLIKLNWPNKKVYATGSEIELFKVLGEMDFIKDVVFKESLVIITDTGSTPRIDESRWNLAKKVIKIDHHPDENKFGDIQWVDDSFTSASEMIAWFARELNLKINEDVSQTIMYGITTDSNRFFAKNVTEKTFLACAYLMKPKWNIVDLYQKVYKKSVNFLKAESEVILNMTTSKGVGVLILTKEIMEKYKIPYDQNDIFTNLFQGCEELKMWVVFSANKDGTYRTEFRSLEIPIKAIAQKYGGGGHELIAGATIKDNMIPKIISDLQDLASKK